MNTMENLKVAEGQQGDGYGEEANSPQREVLPQNRGTAFIKQNQVEALQSRWQTIQMEFVDKPKGTVAKADQLIEEVIDRLEQLLTQKRDELKQEWGRSDEPTTEELRLALQHYRTFLNQLLSV